jgi:5'-methylthioadenosine phosphorylase
MTTPASASPESAPLGIIGGSAFLEAVELSGTTLREVETPRGPVALHAGEDFVFLRRHGEGVYRPPHRIPHHAHVLALESLRLELRPGDVVVPDDYLSWHPPPTFAADDYLHVVPSLDPLVRGLLTRAAERALGSRGSSADGPALVRAGVYAEMRGPRFETPAEVRMLAPHAHVVGMTAASEATLCQERGVGYAMICTVDNWAHGIGSPALTLEAFQANLALSAALAREVLGELLREWRGGGAAAVPTSRPE